MDIVNYRGGGPVEMGLARQATHYIYRDPAELAHMALIGHIQAKFYEMVDDDAEYSIPYDRIVPVLDQGGFDGYLSSEYEGNRHIQDAFEVDSVEQVRRQHAMFAACSARRPPTLQRQPEEASCSTSTSSARTASAPGTTAAPGGVVEVRMPYYRGLGLSMVEAVDLVLDGHARAGRPHHVHSARQHLPLDRAAAVTDDRWEMGERAQHRLRGRRAAGAGETHVVVGAVRLRISYMPVPGGGRDSKTLALA